MLQRWPDYTVKLVYSVATPQDPTSWLLYRGGLIIQWNLCIVATPQDPISWLLYRGGLIIQWDLCIVAISWLEMVTFHGIIRPLLHGNQLP